MGKEPEWKVDKQPAWLVAAIRRTIADLPHGYEEAAEILGLYKSDDITPAKDQLHNRLRSGGDQIFPLEWAMVLQDASGTRQDRKSTRLNSSHRVKSRMPSSA